MPETFATIFPQELGWLRRRRKSTERATLPETAATPTATLGLTGLALSGGGVRSAAFSLGVLQALNCRVGLRHLDYLSTVSGGGYIGTATTIGMTRKGGEFPFCRGGADPGETPDTQHLRDNSRYLVKDGFPSVLGFLAVYLRGMAMNALTLLPLMLLAAILLVFAFQTHDRIVSGEVGNTWLAGRSLPFATVLLPAAGVALAVYAMLVSLLRIAGQRRYAAAWAGHALALVIALVIVFDLHPLLLAAVREQVLPGGRTLGDAAAQDSIFGWTWLWLSALAPVLAFVVPYLKPIAAKAATSALESWGDFGKRALSRVILLVLALVIPVLLWSCTMQLALWAIGRECLTDACDAATRWSNVPGAISWAFALADPVLAYAAAALLCFATWPFLSVNANSLHQLYRDRLGSAFLVSSRQDGRIEPEDEFALSEVTPHAPYHLINTALNVPGAKEANERGRNADFFVFSPLFVGSRLTGYVPTATAEKVVDGLNIGTAMAISGAAAAPNMGMASIRPLSPTIAFLNVRLGRWVTHPLAIERDSEIGAKSGRPGPRYLLREAFAKSGFRPWVPDRAVRWKQRGGRPSDFVFLTDGGHIENLGAYELLRRRCKLVIVVDGEADHDGKFLSLQQLERFARIDLGIRIVIDVRPIVLAWRAVDSSVRQGRFPERRHGPHVAVGVIDYPPAGDPEGPREEGILVYVKASVSGDENDYVAGYKARRHDFPQETTADQLFSEEQFEAYRSLGEHVMHRFLAGDDEVAGFDDDRVRLLAEIAALLPARDRPVADLPATARRADGAEEQPRTAA
jgi:hypothetical protein